jgi:DNA-binding MarR family transcriptional regulator
MTNIVLAMESKLRQEIGKRHAFQSLRQEVTLNLMRTADALMRQVEALFKPYTISPTHYNVLRILRGAGEAGLSCRDVSDRMITRDPDMTRLLDRLEKRALIQRRRDTEDRRVVKTRITPAGLALLAELDEPVRQLHEQQLVSLDDQQLQTLNALLDLARSKADTSEQQQRQA